VQNLQSCLSVRAENSSLTFQELRETEYSRLDERKQVYLDYTGGGLYARSQIESYVELLQRSIIGNPHSQSPASIRGTQMVEETRLKILNFFNADEQEYAVVFSSNATGAIKLVAESYPFRNNSVYALTADNHNSINGVREYAMKKEAHVRYIPLNENLEVDDIESGLPAVRDSAPSLFAYPAQSNFSGIQHPLDWIDFAHSKGYDVLLDAAAYVPTNRLDLGIFKPEFVPISFYKMFGFPTGIGALLIKHSLMDRLSRPWFSGGTIQHVTTMHPSHSEADSVQRFEDGTVDYLGIPGVAIGLEFLRKIGMERIHQHVMSLTSDFLREVESLTHSNGRKMISVYGPSNALARGGTVAFNVVSPEGVPIDFRVVGEHAAKSNISIRTGCFCNPGAGEYAFGFSPEREKACLHRLSKDFTPELFSECISGSAKGAVRASFGVATNDFDINSLVRLLKTFRDYSHAQDDEKRLPPLSC